jgi:hypothetical protein
MAQLDRIYPFVMASILLTWLLISMISQIPRLKRVRQHDRMSLIPNFSFFAPKPLENDYRLVFRWQYQGGEVGSWLELPYCEKRRAWSPVWNPDRRQQKALIDSCSMLLRHIAAVRESVLEKRTKNPILAVQTSLPYLNILNHVSSLSDYPENIAVQFAVFSDPGPLASEKAKLLFVSSLHRIEGASAT